MTRWILTAFLALIIASGCTYLSTTTERPSPSQDDRLRPADSAGYANLAFDPMTLGPSVFASLEMPGMESADAKEQSPVLASKTSGYRVQLGAFIDQALAEKLAERAEQELSEPAYVVYDRPFFRVRVGNCKDLQTADLLKSRAIQQGYSDARIASDEIESAP